MALYHRTLALSLALVAIPVTQACMGVGSRPVTFNGQKNIVVWDPRTHVEHFIRDAKFDPTVPDLGFIAPTPTEPDLGEAKSMAFTRLETLRPVMKGRGLGFPGGIGGGTGGGGESVTVIAEKDVAGYHATILKATDAGALTNWLKVNAYKVNGSEQEWLDFYVKKNWYFTAFKVLKTDQPDKGAPIRTGAIRITFKTDEAINPYYVPVENIPSKYRPSDQLTVLFVAPGKYDVSIGHAAPWDATKQWEAKLPEDMSNKLAKDIGIPAYAMPENCTVTSYLDRKFPRASWDDLFFTKIPEKQQQRSGGIGFGLLALGIIPLALVVRRGRR